MLLLFGNSGTQVFYLDGVFFGWTGSISAETAILSLGPQV
jgi:hypothetical protein